MTARPPSTATIRGVLESPEMSGLSSTARTVLLTLWVLADGWPRPWPSMTELAQASGLSRAQVLAGLDELRAAGVL